MALKFLQAFFSSPDLRTFGNDVPKTLNAFSNISRPIVLEFSRSILSSHCLILVLALEDLTILNQSLEGYCVLAVKISTVSPDFKECLKGTILPLTLEPTQ